MNKLEWYPQELLREVDQKTDSLIDLMSESVLSDAMSEVPVNTGRLQESITINKLGLEKAASIGTGVDYALFVEYGTRYMPAQPYLRPAIDALNSKVNGMIEQVSGL